MSYTPYEWKNGKEGGTPINADNLNHIEQGIHDNSVEISNLENEVEEVKKSVNTGAIIIGVSGGKITLTDSAEAPLQSLKVYGKSTQTQTSGKQLFNATLQSGTFNGISYTRYSDGTYLLTGTATDTAGLQFGRCDFVSGVKYRLVGFHGTGIKDQFALYVNGLGYPNDIGNGITFTANSTGNYSISIAIPTGTTVNMLLKPMLTTDLSATYDDYEPYTGGIPAPNPDYPQPISDVDNAEVTVQNKNFVEIECLPRSVSMSGITYTNNNDGSITVSGTSTGYSQATGYSELVLKKGTYTLSGKYAQLRRWSQKSEVIANEGETFTLEEDTGVDVRIVISASGISLNETIILQIEKGNSVTEAEVRKSQTATIPYTLRGIGNVKDELLVNADGTGKWITRFGKVDLGTLNYSYDSSSRRFYSTQLKGLVKAPVNASTALRGICESYSVTYWNKLNESGTDNFIVYLGGSSEQIGIRDTRYTTPADFKSAMNGVNLIYELATPIETNLTSEEVAQILTLNTFKPTSIISNNKQAEMEIKYIADTKAYVDAHSGGGSTEQIYPNNPNEPIKIGKFGNKDVMRKYILFAIPEQTTEQPFNVTLAEGIDLVVNKTIFFNNSGLPNASEVTGKRGSYLELSSYAHQVDYVEYSNYIFLDEDKLIARFGGRQGTLEVKGFIDYVPR